MVLSFYLRRENENVNENDDSNLAVAWHLPIACAPDNATIS
jgi:hypothetical protein